jgi:uncharacterized protein
VPSVIDRRSKDKNKSVMNRTKFLNRARSLVREGVRKAIQDGKITDIVSDKPEKITVPEHSIHEPRIRHGEGGVVERVLPGNKEFLPGDKLRKPPKGEEGSGSEGSPDGDGVDDFTFVITREEFQDIFFEDLELPDLVKRSLGSTEEYEWKRKGFTNDGAQNQLHIPNSLKRSMGRRARAIPLKRELRRLREELEELEAIEREERQESEEERLNRRRRIEEIEDKIKVLERQIKAIGVFLDDIDLKYRYFDKEEIPVLQAVMFCLMDVSGSMSEWHKEMSKRFFMLLYFFLSRNYEKVEIVYIRHHHKAQEVDHEEFFHSRESGGTVVSTALILMDRIISERYPLDQWNIYGCHASDGDNYFSDADEIFTIMNERILPVVQYFAYAQVRETSWRTEKESTLESMYNLVATNHQNFAKVEISEARDIYPVFRDLFERKAKV